MAIKREAAFHEAGHAIAAYRSRFHNIGGSINLQDGGAGEVNVALSKSKLQANGKPVDRLAAQLDKEIIIDLAVVLSAGLVAERLAQEHGDGMAANPSSALHDHRFMRQSLAIAGLSKHFDRHEDAAKQILESQWDLVCSLAEYLFENESIRSADVMAFIEQHS
jgi:ATP-dependent Zn protease